jgi:hypothetical protein
LGLIEAAEVVMEIDNDKVDEAVLAILTLRCTRSAVRGRALIGMR